MHLIEYMLHNAQSHITIYNQTLTDDAILDILRDKKSQWVIVEVCTADNESNREKVGEYSFPWARVKKPYLHAKIIITDKTYLFIWSQNLTHNAIENNRELWIILEKDSVLLPKIWDIIQQDCIFE